MKRKGGATMNTDFVRNRISQLRIKKGVSEYRMSSDLGHSKSYIQSISRGKALLKPLIVIPLLLSLIVLKSVRRFCQRVM